MGCEKRLLLQRTAVFEPKILRSEPWQAHLAQCDVCRDAWYNLELSLAVYQHLERDGTESHDAGSLCWPSFSRRLRADGRSKRSARMLNALAVAALAGIIVLGGTAALTGWHAPPTGKAESAANSRDALHRLQSRRAADAGERSRIPAIQFVSRMENWSSPETFLNALAAPFPSTANNWRIVPTPSPVTRTNRLGLPPRAGRIAKVQARYYQPHPALHMTRQGIPLPVNRVDYPSAYVPESRR